MAGTRRSESADELRQLITGSSTSRAWATEAGKADEPPQWQHDVIARILALTFDQEIEYLSTAMPDGNDWDIVAFTQATVVRVTVSRNGDSVSHIESFAFPRSSLESLELIEVDSIPVEDRPWPAKLGMIGHYHSAIVNLPLDQFASRNNQRDLTHLLSSLLADLSH